MPSRPKLRLFEKHIKDLGGDEVVFDLIADGRKMEAVASTFRGFLPSDPEFPSRSWMYTWIHAGGEERERVWARAKEIAAHNILDDLDEEIEGADPVVPAEVSHMKLKAHRAEKRAAAFFPEMYGEKKEGINVNVDIGQLHLDALRKAGGRDRPEIEGREEPKVLEAELVEEGDA